MKVEFRIKRFNPEKDKKPHFQRFEVDLEPTDRVLDGLKAIKWHQDGTLSFRHSCAHGICGSDAMLINGVNRLACKVLVQDVGNRIKIEPLMGMKVIKDLIVDLEPFFEHYRSVLPYLINDEQPPTQERLQSPEDRARFDDTTKCILCAACTTSCPSFWFNGGYVGPAAIVNAHRFLFDSRDKGTQERLAVLDDTDGVWRCRTIFNCVDACPRDIRITEAIEDVKRELMFEGIN